MTDPLSDRPAYRQVADRLRQPIDSGEWPAGHKLPSESELMEQFNVSRVTVRLAVGALRAEGLILTRQGRGSFVRDREATRRISSTRYRQDARYAAGRVAEPASGFGHHAEDRFRLERRFREERASQQVADLLGLQVGDPVLQRRYVYYVDERPEQICTSYLPMELVKDTPVADPTNEPWAGGTIAQLASLGQKVTRVTESVRARMPTPEESSTLRISAGVPVLVVVRRMLTGPDGDQPVEAAVDMVLPADRVVLDYVVDLAD
ncbi:MAG TPA: GntR family transcriptional regulator [Pseudonocardiaceae bacterium]|jgi:GntR family transcriptional regulator